MMGVRFQRVRAVLFDAVGTLIYPEPPVAEAYHLAAWSYGSQLTAEEIGRRFSNAFARCDAECLPTSEAAERERWRKIVREVIDDVPPADECKLFDALWSHFARPEHWRQYADVPAVWDTLANRGYAVGVASNFDGRLRGVLRGHPPLSGCQTLFVSSQVGYPKPAAEFFTAVEQRLQLLPEEILLVGDDERNDRQGARAAGWQALLLQRGVPGDSDDCIQSLAELLERLPARAD